MVIAVERGMGTTVLRYSARNSAGTCADSITQLGEVASCCALRARSENSGPNDSGWLKRVPNAYTLRSSEGGRRDLAAHLECAGGIRLVNRERPLVRVGGREFSDLQEA